MSETVGDFKRVFLGKVSDNALTAKKNVAVTAAAAITPAIDLAANAAPPPAVAALDKVREQATRLRDAAAAARPNGESSKDSWKAYEKIEADAAKQVKAAEALALAAGKLAKMKSDMAKPGGIAALDKQIAKIGNAAKSTEDKATLIAAMQARYGLDVVAGSLSTKALPKLYKVFAMVPESHARLNDSLKVLERSKANAESDYNAGELRVRLNAGGTGLSFNLGDSKYVSGTGKATKLEHFTVTALHEIGHAVDEKKGYMAANGKSADHGKWAATDIDKIAAVADGTQGFATRFATLTAPVRLAVLRQVLASGKVASIQVNNDAAVLPQFDPADWLGLDELEDVATERGKLDTAGHTLIDTATNGAYLAAKRTACAKFASKPFDLAMVNLILAAMEKGPGDVASGVAVIESRKQVALAYPPPTSHAAIENDPAVAWLLSVRMKDESSGLWSGGKGAAATAALGDVVYQESYKGKYWTYSLSSRDKQVSDYQFRAPGEWYAEAYAMFYMKKLAKDHPLHSVLLADKGT